MGLNGLLGFKGPTHLMLIQTHPFDTPRSNPATYNTIAQQSTPTQRVKTLLNKEGSVKESLDPLKKNHLHLKIIYFIF